MAIGQERSHPTPERLTAFHDAAASLAPTERAGIEQHVTACQGCRDTLRALGAFDFEALRSETRPARRSAAVLAADVLAALRGRLSPPVWVAAVLLILAVPVAFAFWAIWAGDPGSPSARTPLVASTEPNRLEREPTLLAVEEPDSLPPQRLHEQVTPERETTPTLEYADRSPAEPSVAPELQLAEAQEPHPPTSVVLTEPEPVEERAEVAAERKPPAETPARVARTQSEPAADAPPPEASDTVSFDVASAPIFAPPNREMPEWIVGGRMRSVTLPGTPEVQALVPAAWGLTLSDQPNLYWHLSALSKRRVKIGLEAFDSAERLFEVTLDGPFEPGVHRIRLADHGVRLQLGVEYRWFVQLAPDASRSWESKIAEGGIERIAPDARLRSDLAGAKPSRRASVLAAAGIWYDALDAVSKRVEAAPDDPGPRKQRAVLLKQVGLPEPAPVHSQ